VVTAVGYRIRILGTKLNPAPLEELRKLALPALLEADERVGDEWEALTLKHPSGVPIALIEKDLVVSGELGGEELNEFIDGVSYYKPDSAVAWLKEYLPKVKVIYSFQLLSGTEIDDGFDLMHRVYGGCGDTPVEFCKLIRKDSRTNTGIRFSGSSMTTFLGRGMLVSWEKTASGFTLR